MRLNKQFFFIEFIALWFFAQIFPAHFDGLRSRFHADKPAVRPVRERVEGIIRELAQEKVLVTGFLAIIGVSEFLYDKADQSCGLCLHKKIIENRDDFDAMVGIVGEKMVHRLIIQCLRDSGYANGLTLAWFICWEFPIEALKALVELEVARGLSDDGFCKEFIGAFGQPFSSAVFKEIFLSLDPALRLKVAEYRLSNGRTLLWCVVRFRIGIEAIRLVADAMSVEGLKDALMRGPSHGEPVLVLAGQAGDQKIIDCLLKSLDPEARDRFVHYCQSYPAPKG